MGQAVLESVGYAIRDVLSVMEEKGIVTEELRITGKPSKSDLWNQIKANITGKTILVPQFGESELAGDLCVALFGLGEFESPAEASENIVRFTKTFTPEADKRALYSELFHLYRDSYQSLKPVFTRLANIPN
jgi:xylulokinase